MGQLYSLERRPWRSEPNGRNLEHNQGLVGQLQTHRGSAKKNAADRPQVATRDRVSPSRQVLAVQARHDRVLRQPK